jgi:ABC-type nitrate/sulfonate/bicarbonate transport system permease component
VTNFWQLLKESTIMQAILSLVVVGAYVYMLIAGVPVSDAFIGFVGLVIGFFFGGKLGVATATQRNAVDNLNAIVQASQPSNKEDN